MVDGKDVFVQTLEPNTGVRPSITRGRAPVRDDEITLGKKVLAQLGKHVGDKVDIAVGEDGAQTVTFDVVGETILASPLFRSLVPDEGGLITDTADERWFNEGTDPYLVSFHDGVTPRQGFDAVYAGYPDLGPFGFTRNARGDVVALDSMVVLPWILVGFLGVMAIAALAQWSIIASRRERHRAAVLPRSASRARGHRGFRLRGAAHRGGRNCHRDHARHRRRTRALATRRGMAAGRAGAHDPLDGVLGGVRGDAAEHADARRNRRPPARRFARAATPRGVIHVDSHST